MTEPLPRLLLRLSEAGEPAILWGRLAAPYAGRAFDRLVDHGVLIEQVPATESDVCSSCECGLEARPIQRIGGGLVAACPIDHDSDVVLDDDDLRSFRIDPPALVREIAISSGFGDEPSSVVAGVWYLGETSSQRAVFLALARGAILQPGVIRLMRSITRSMPMTLISPGMNADDQARVVDAGLHLVSVADCIAGNETASGFGIAHSELEPRPSLPPRLVIGRAARIVSLDGHSKALSEQEFKLLLVLAEHALKSPAVLENRQIEASIWGSNIHRISSQVREPVRALRDALARECADPKAARALIENRRNPNGYRLALTPADIKLNS